MIQKLKKNKKGFTLVELIVVVAILGVLMAVLVPQYIQYVETSREGVDRSTISEIYHAMEITAASKETALTGDQLTITVAEKGGVTYSGNSAPAIEKVCPAADSSMKSKSGQGLGAITITMSTDGSVGWKTAIPSIGGVNVAGNIAVTA